MTRNPVGWFEIYVQDMERAKAFYENVLSRPLEALTPPGADGSSIAMWAFPMLPEAGGAAGALVHMPGAPSGHGGTLIYFSCEDCAVEAGRVVAQGGTVVRDKISIAPYGFIALITDPDENLIGLHSLR